MIAKATDYQTFVRNCDANPSLTYGQVAEKMGISLWQGIAFAKRLATERSEA